MVTLGLAATGAVVGALLSPFLLVALIWIRSGATVAPYERPILAVAAAVGATIGAVLAPIAAWLLMRHVPIWRAIAETLGGTMVGAAAGSLLGPIGGFSLMWPIFLGILGFVAAAARLRFSRRQRDAGIEAPTA